VLEVDHITPVADGGTNDIINLVTACKACNSGKSDKQLSDTSAIEKRRAQLEDLEERRQQLEMLHDWHMSLIDLNEQAVDMAESLWFESLGKDDLEWNDAARAEIRKLIKKDGFDAVCGAIREAADCALRSSRIASDPDGVRSQWFWKIGRVLSVQKAEDKDPGVSRLFYIRGILRNRCNYLNEHLCISILEEARGAGINIDWLEWLAKRVTSWTQFRNRVTEEIDAGKPADEEATDGTNT
jgi:hypothetical protein